MSIDGKHQLSKIVGGIIVGANDYPFFAFPDGNMLCGATLIWNDILVSAAHCGDDAWKDGVWLGGNHLNGKKSKFFTVNKTVIHPDYDSTVNDIMLMKIDGNVSGPYANLNFDPSVPVDGQELTAIGYGHTSEGGQISPKLRKVNFFAVGYDECYKTYGSSLVDEIMLCNGGILEGGKDTCQGDSGGPIFLDGTKLIVGLVSFGEGCAQAGIPAVNARVSAFEDWITGSICELSAYPPASCAFYVARTPKTKVPTPAPTNDPTYRPTRRPTKKPIKPPTKKPVPRPTKQPVKPPTKKPVLRPTKQPVKPSTAMPDGACAKKKLGERCTWAYECCGVKPKCAGAVVKICS
jgi:trypsin